MVVTFQTCRRRTSRLRKLLATTKYVKHRRAVVVSKLAEMWLACEVFRVLAYLHSLPQRCTSTSNHTNTYSYQRDSDNQSNFAFAFRMARSPKSYLSSVFLLLHEMAFLHISN
jgi:hypothetical protein